MWEDRFKYQVLQVLRRFKYFKYSVMTEPICMLQFLISFQFHFNFILLLRNILCMLMNEYINTLFIRFKRLDYKPACK